MTPSDLSIQNPLKNSHRILIFSTQAQVWPLSWRHLVPQCHDQFQVPLRYFYTAILTSTSHFEYPLLYLLPIMPALSPIAPPDLPLYTHPNPGESATFRFLARINATLGLSLKSYQDLYTWSTTHIDEFWSAVWDETNIIGHKGGHVVDNAALPPSNPVWFAPKSHIQPYRTQSHYFISCAGFPRQDSTGLKIHYNVVPLINLLLFKLVSVFYFPHIPF